LIPVLFAELISWNPALNVWPIKTVLHQKNVKLLGELAIMHFISIAFQDGSKQDKCVHLTTEIGNGRNMVNLENNEEFSI